MRFSWKILLVSLLVSALTLAIGGWLLIQYTFDITLHRDITRALNDNKLIAYAFDTAAFAEYSQQGTLNNTAAESIARQLTTNYSVRIQITDENSNLIYSNLQGSSLILQPDNRSYVLLDNPQGKTLTTTIKVETNSRLFWLTTEHSIFEPFSNRNEQFRIFRTYSIIILLINALVMFVVSGYLTKSVRKLTLAARGIRRGDYTKRVAVHGNDEIAELAQTFNNMAQSVGQNVEQLTQAARQREEFVANFAHELKTPLTSIIGYADLLRSQKLTPEKEFTAANYIYSEGKRLESLSLKLMEMIVVGKQSFLMKKTNAKNLLEETAGIASVSLANAKMTLSVSAQEAVVVIEPDLFKTLILNLIDNVRKASEPGADIRLTGSINGDSYVFSIEDHGRGIPEEELDKITEAFYMVDKSRSRAQHGAGLGLALCQSITQLHQTQMQFASKVGEGTTVTVSLPIAKSLTGKRRIRV